MRKLMHAAFVEQCEGSLVLEYSVVETRPLFAASNQVLARLTRGEIAGRIVLRSSP